MTMRDLLPRPDCLGAGRGKPYGGTPSPSDPIVGGLAAEGAAIAFADRVRQDAELIVLVEQRTFLPARWNTVDGQRPANPHQWNLGYAIITPERAKVITVAKGDYDLPELYVAHYGGQIGQDCMWQSNSLYQPIGPIGTQFLYLLYPYERAEIYPAENDRRYRFYEVSRIYPVSPDGLITIGPESDIMRNRKDDPPRTLTVDEVLAEIAALTATPATPTPR